MVTETSLIITTNVLIASPNFFRSGFALVLWPYVFGTKQALPLAS